jgi:ankyrin repeat protein
VVDARDCDGITPLHAAARVGARAALAALLEAGADATIKCEQGRTPRQLAILAQHKDAAAQLDAMSLAIVDGDYAECIRLARNGNWPLDWTAGADDVEGYEDDDDVGEAPAPAPAPQTPEKDDAPAPPTYEPYVRGAADVDDDADAGGDDDADVRPPTPPDDDAARSQNSQDFAY